MDAGRIGDDFVVPRGARDGSGSNFPIDGWLPTPASGEWPLPRRFRRRIGNPARYHHYPRAHEQSAVQITIADQHGLAEAERSRSADDAILPGRVAATLVATQSDYGATLRIAANALIPCDNRGHGPAKR